MMSTDTAVRAWLRAMMADRELSVERLSALSGVHKSTIFRALNEESPFLPTTRTIAKLANAMTPNETSFPVDYPEGSDGRLSENGQFLPITRSFGQGLFEVKAHNQGPSPFAPSAREDKERQWVGELTGYGAEREARTGDLFHVVSPRSWDYLPLSEGDLVVAQTRIENAQMTHRHVERWLTQVVEAGDDGFLTLEAPTDVGDKRPLRLRRGEEQIARGFSTSLDGLVIAQYRARHRLAR